MSANQINNVLTSLELDHLAEVREVCGTVNSGGWHRIIKQIEAFVEEAHEDIFANVSPDPRNAQLLQLRWQQREAMLRGIRHYIKSCEQAKLEILSEVKEHSVPMEPYNDRMDESA